MIRLDTEAERDRFASLLVSLSMAVRLAEDALLIALARQPGEDPHAWKAGEHRAISRRTSVKIVEQGRDALANLLGWIAGDNPRALDLARMRLMEMTAELITIGHAREIVDELRAMRDAVSDLGELAEDG